MDFRRDSIPTAPSGLSLRAAGFAETYYEHDREGAAFYTKRLPAGQVPHARDNLIDEDFIAHEDETVIEITPDQRVQIVVPDADFILEPVPVNSDEGRDMLRGLGLDA